MMKLIGLLCALVLLALATALCVARHSNGLDAYAAGVIDEADVVSTGRCGGDVRPAVVPGSLERLRRVVQQAEPSSHAAFQPPECEFDILFVRNSSDPLEIRVDAQTGRADVLNRDERVAGLQFNSQQMSEIERSCAEQHDSK